MSSILFVHPNFPAQFRHIAARFGQQGHQVLFLTASQRTDWQIAGVQRVVYTPAPPQEGGPLFGPQRQAEAQAEAVLRAGVELKQKGFTPDVIYGASGWGSTWFLRDVFPKARIAGYFEWFYDAGSEDVRLGGREEPSLGNRVHLRLRNPVILNDLLACDLKVVPSAWQRAQFPACFQSEMTVLHDGIDTSYFAPQATRLKIPGLALTGSEEIITYATRGMEPYRGFPQFIQALALVLAKRPHAHAVIAGEDRVCYGSPRPDGKSWKTFMLEQTHLPMDRVHFTGSLPYGQYRQLLRCSTVHVYLTRPFVLSWSLLEAMACGSLVVASATAPVLEAIQHGHNGLLCDFSSPQAIASAVLAALEQQESLQPLREEARATILKRYNLADALPRLEELLLPDQGKGM